jgi:hypothetical protein
MNGHDAGGRFDPSGRFHLNRQTVFVTGPIDANLIADHQGRQQCERPDPFEIHAFSPSPCRDPMALIALHNQHAGVKPARLLRLIPGAFDERVLSDPT